MKMPVLKIIGIELLALSLAFTLSHCSQVQVAKTCSGAYVQKGNETLGTCDETRESQRAPASAKVSGEKDWNAPDWMTKLPKKAQ